MPKKRIRLIGDPILRQISAPVALDTEEIQDLVQDLTDTLTAFQGEHKIGRAIAAPQIGCLKRLVVVKTPELELAMVNPVITHKSPETFDAWDSCFSAGVKFFGKTRRHQAITVTWFRPDGTAREQRFENDLSELLQHEIDHLDGILFTDHILENQIIMREEWEKQYQG